MVKYLFIFLLSALIISCKYSLIPNYYFNNYKSISSNSKDTFTLNIQKVYVYEDTSLTNEYHKSFNYNGKSLIYTFFYKNNLMATIITPFFSSGQFWEVDINQLTSYIKNGYFNNPLNYDKIDWTYYKVENYNVIEYFLQYNSSQGWILNNGKVRVIKFLNINRGLIWEGYLKKDSSLIKNYLKIPISISIKPDSSKCDFIRMYNKYINTNKRRYYADPILNEKYINEK